MGRFIVVADPLNSVLCSISAATILDPVVLLTGAPAAAAAWYCCTAEQGDWGSMGAASKAVGQPFAGCRVCSVEAIPGSWCGCTCPWVWRFHSVQL